MVGYIKVNILFRMKNGYKLQTVYEAKSSIADNWIETWINDVTIKLYIFCSYDILLFYDLLSAFESGYIWYI